MLIACAELCFQFCYYFRICLYSAQCSM